MVEVFPCRKVNSYNPSRPVEGAIYNFASVATNSATDARSNFRNIRQILYKPNLPLATTILFRVSHKLPMLTKREIKCTAK